MIQDCWFKTNDPETTIHIDNVYMNPTQYAIVEYRLSYKQGGSTRLTVKIEGDEYRRWGSDDHYLFHYLALKNNLQYIEEPEPEFIDYAYVEWQSDGTWKNVYTKRPNPKYDPTRVISSNTQ